MPYMGKSKYYEIKEQLEAQIIAGDYPVGSQLPSEPRLSELFNASRGTVRLALSALEREGVIARRSGIGTQVVRQPKQAVIVSFSQQVREKGKHPSTQVLFKQRLPLQQAQGRASEAFLSFDDETPEDVYCIDRLRLADNLPVARQTIYLRASEFGPNLLEEEDFTGSLFQTYSRHHRRAAWADEIIEARRPTADEAALLHMLDLPECDRLVYVRNRITYDDDNMPLEVLASIERADFFGQYQYRLLSDG